MGFESIGALLISAIGVGVFLLWQHIKTLQIENDSKDIDDEV